MIYSDVSTVKSHPIITLTRQVIKVFANLVKVFSYGFHFFSPNKRFLIADSNSVIKFRSTGRKIPSIIWQTNFTDRLTLPVFLNYLFNRLMAPTFNYRFMTTEARSEFVKEHYPGRIFSAYSRIQIGAAQADFWRLLVLQKYGGVYLDIDAHLVWPLEKILSPDQEELFIKIKTGEISNYFIASKPDNPNLKSVIDRIVENIELESSENVYDLTGPGVLNEVFLERNIPKRYYLYTCNQGNFTNEYFQYIDKPQGKWTTEQKKTPVLKSKADVTP